MANWSFWRHREVRTNSSVKESSKEIARATGLPLAVADLVGAAVHTRALTLTREHVTEGALVRAFGQLLTANVPELENICAGIAGRLMLDLANLQLADSNGIQALKALQRRGVQLIAASPRLLRLLEAAPAVHFTSVAHGDARR